METNFKEQLHDTRPYWKVIVSLTFSLIATILFIYVAVSYTHLDVYKRQRFRRRRAAGPA